MLKATVHLRGSSIFVCYVHVLVCTCECVRFVFACLFVCPERARTPLYEVHNDWPLPSTVPLPETKLNYLVSELRKLQNTIVPLTERELQNKIVPLPGGVPLNQMVHART